MEIGSTSSYTKHINTIRQFDVIFQNIGFGITVQNRDGRLFYVNKEAARLSGFSTPDKMLKAGPIEIAKKFTMLDQKGNIYPFEKLPGRLAMRDKRTHEAVIRYKIHRSGKERWSIVKAVPVQQVGRIEFIVNTIQDITTSKREEERRDYFLAIASHEFKTPLTSIKALAQILERRLAIKKYQDMRSLLPKIEKKVDELTHIINDFLDMSKIRAGKLEFSYEVFNFDKLAEETIKDFQSITPSHRINKKGHVTKPIISDTQRIRYVLTNLLRNARKYSPSGKSIIVTVKTGKNNILVTVKDFGIGIPKAYHKRVFEPFFRMKEREGEQKSGLGIGLFICQQSIYLLGGKLWVRSTPGKGSTFYFTLPYKPVKRKRRFKDVYKF